jgi:hypothetical protein
MKKKVIILFFLIVSCSNLELREPENLISVDEMESILFDLIIINSARSSSYQNPKYSSSLGDIYIYKKYKVDSSQLVESEFYYSKRPKIYLKIHQNVQNRLKELYIKKDKK